MGGGDEREAENGFNGGHRLLFYEVTHFGSAHSSLGTNIFRRFTRAEAFASGPWHRIPVQV